jgi:hypothetical protein
LEKKMKRDTVSAYRSRARATEQMVDQSVAAIKAEGDEKWAASKAAVAAQNASLAFTEEQYKAARVIRTRLGWYEVVRVSAKSVTVKTPHSWNDRILRSKILEVRS